MKKSIFLASLLLCSINAVAQPFISHCQLPESLNQKSIVSTADQNYSPDNPFAGSIMQLDFGEGVYKNTIYTKNLKIDGRYDYEKLNDTVAIIKAKEEFGGETTQYTFVLNCLTDYSGTAVYTQTQGALQPNIRQNTSTYAIKSSAEL